MYEQKEKLERVKKSCETSRKIIKVLQIIMIVLAIVTALGAVFCLMNHAKIDQVLAPYKDNITVTNINYNNGFIYYDTDLEHLAKLGHYGQIIGDVLAFAAVSCLIVSIILGLCKKVFIQVLASDSPFSPEVLRMLKKVFIIIVVLTLLSKGFGLALIVGLAFWCVYRIMEYGAALQEEIDDTV